MEEAQSITNSGKKRGRPKSQNTELQHAILDESLKIFAQYGFEGTSVKMISNNVGIDDSLIYYHFKSKVNLWNQALIRLDGLYNEEAGNIIRLNKDLESIDLGKSLVRHIIYFMSEHTAYCQIIMHEMAQKTDRSDWIIDNILKPFNDKIVSVLEGYQKAGYAINIPVCNYFSINFGLLSTFFLMNNLNQRLFNVDTFDKKEIDRHADIVIDIIYSSIFKVKE